MCKISWFVSWSVEAILLRWYALRYAWGNGSSIIGFHFCCLPSKRKLKMCYIANGSEWWRENAITKILVVLLFSGIFSSNSQIEFSGAIICRIKIQSCSKLKRITWLVSAWAWFQINFAQVFGTTHRIRIRCVFFLSLGWRMAATNKHYLHISQIVWVVRFVCWLVVWRDGKINATNQMECNRLDE